MSERAGGGVVIVDYKTGKPPSAKDIALGLAPQLPLEGVIFEAGGFSSSGESKGQPELAELQFWQLSGDEAGGRLERRSVELIEAAREGFLALVSHYDQATTTYPAAYRPPTARRGDYDHLARLGEWPN